MKTKEILKSLKKATSFLVILSVALSILFASAFAQNPADGRGAYSSGKYRNLFKERGHSDKDIKTKIDAGFRQLFFGDSTETLYFQDGRNENGPLAYLSDVLHNDIRSEGMSYGMMIAVQMNRKDVFDALWNYALTRMYISSKDHPSEGYFSWSLKRNGVANEETPAPDGEEYFVTSLYFASGRWGNGSGIYNYRAWADKILTTMRHHEVKSGMTKYGPSKIGPMVNEDRKMILFVPGLDQKSFTDPSYHLPHFYELWGRWGPREDREFWLAAADTSRVFFTKTTHPATALSSDYATFDGAPQTTPFNKNSANFSYDSWRTASNWSVDWSWFGKATIEQDLSNRIQKFFISQGPHTYGCQFTPDGKLLDSRHAGGLVAANAVTSLAAMGADADRFIDALWNMPVPQKIGERYYDGLLYLMSMMHCSGNFRIYKPQ